MFASNQLVWVESYTLDRRRFQVRRDLPAVVLTLEEGNYRVRFENDHEEVLSPTVLMPMDLGDEAWLRKILGTYSVCGKRGYHCARRGVDGGEE